MNLVGYNLLWGRKKSQKPGKIKLRNLRWLQVPNLACCARKSAVVQDYLGQGLAAMGSGNAS